MAVRLTFAFDPSGMRLVDRTTVGKPAGAGEDPAAPWPAEAIGAELRRADQRVTFRRFLPPGAMPADAEVFDPAVPGGVRRDPAPVPTGVFTVVVPDDDDAEEVVLVAGTGAARRVALSRAEQAEQADQADPAEPAGGPTVVARFPFRDR